MNPVHLGAALAVGSLAIGDVLSVLIGVAPHPEYSLIQAAIYTCWAVCMFVAARPWRGVE